MKAIILKKELSEFTTKEGTLLKGWNITILRNDLTSKEYWVAQDKAALIGFVDRMVTNPFNGDKPLVIEVNFDEKPGYQGKPSKIVPTDFKAA